MRTRYDLERLREMQMKIAARVILEDRFRKPIKVITGFDASFLDDQAVVAAVSVNYNTLEVIERKVLKEKVHFPYIPTFLGFREGPLVTKLLKKLRVKPDVLMLDAQGVAHPLFCGCASHVGVLAQKPTIGVAKSLLCGEYREEPREVGAWVPLVYMGRVVGAVFKSKRGCRPLFVSPGHMISLASSIQIVKGCVRGYKLPEPLHLAHRLAVEKRKLLLG